MQFTQKFKGKVLKGGITLALRQVLVTILSLVNVLVVARMLGPELYGIVAIALGVFYFILWTSKIGLNTYLVRQPDLTHEGAEQILGFYNTAGLGFCVLLAVGAPVFGLWTGQNEVVPLMRLLMLAVWLDMVAAVSLGMLQRDIRFAEVGLIDGLSQFVNYAFAIGLVVLGLGYWGPIIATVIGFVVKAGLAFRYYPVAWRWRWQWSILKPALNYGATYTSSNAIRNAKNLVVPILVSRLVGVRAAGLVSISIRFAQQLAIFRLIIRDMSISIMAKLIDSPEQVRDALRRGMIYQGLLIGPFCAGFSCLSVWIIPLLFGEEWLVSTKIFPFVALGLLVASIFDLHNSTLYASGHNIQVIKFYAAYTGMLWLSALLLLPQFGVWGYAFAEIATFPSFFLIHRSISRIFGSPAYSDVFWVVVATALPLIGGVFLSPINGLILMAFSYICLLVFNAEVRSAPRQIISSIRSR